MEDLVELAGVAPASDLKPFLVRRTVQRLERGEISVALAISHSAWSRHCYPEAVALPAEL